MLFSLSVIFDKSFTKVLMCEHKKFGSDNFIGGKIKPGEDWLDASYREVEEETGITREDMELRCVLYNSVDMSSLGAYDLFVTAGVLNKDVKLQEEKNKLKWIDVNDTPTFLNAYGNGNVYWFLKESIVMLQGVDYKEERE